MRLFLAIAALVTLSAFGGIPLVPFI